MCPRRLRQRKCIRGSHWVRVINPVEAQEDCCTSISSVGGAGSHVYGGQILQTFGSGTTNPATGRRPADLLSPSLLPVVILQRMLVVR